MLPFARTLRFLQQSAQSRHARPSSLIHTWTGWYESDGSQMESDGTGPHSVSSADRNTSRVVTSCLHTAAASVHAAAHVQAAGLEALCSLAQQQNISMHSNSALPTCRIQRAVAGGGAGHQLSQVWVGGRPRCNEGLRGGRAGDGERGAEMLRLDHAGMST